MEQDVIWPQVAIVKPEFRLYYDEKGNVVCYTCEQLEGIYVVIDAQMFAEGRPDLRVVDGKVINPSHVSVTAKLIPDTQGVNCAKEDISIITDDSDVELQKWKLVVHER